MRYLLFRFVGLFNRSRPNKPVLGHVAAIPNRDPHFGAGRIYLRVPVVNRGQRDYLLLTPFEYAKARLRAERNHEDCPRLTTFFGRLRWPIFFNNYTSR